MNWNNIFDYQDGKLYWKNGKVAGCYNKRYATVNFKKKHHSIHRVIWEMFNGPIPEGMEIDHINRVKSDNRIENLRLATRKQNMNNIKAKGYTFHKKANKYVVQIRDNEGIKRHVGLYETKQEARAAYLEAKRIRDGELM
jgi:hypothetical protein